VCNRIRHSVGVGVGVEREQGAGAGGVCVCVCGRWRIGVGCRGRWEGFAVPGTGALPFTFPPPRVSFCDAAFWTTHLDFVKGSYYDVIFECAQGFWKISMERINACFVF